MKKILVTGASGFWGSHLSCALIKEGFKVYGSYFKSRPARIPGVKWLRLDVTDFQAVCRTLKIIKPDAICHLAGQSSLGDAWKLEKKTYELNTLSCLNLLEAIELEIPKCRLVYASSIHVYGKMLRRAKKPLRENSRVLPEGPYGTSKRASELLCLDFHERSGLNTVIIRPVNCVGKGLAQHFAFSDWCAQIAAAEKKKKRPGILRVGNLSVSRDFLYIGDAVRGFILALKKGKAGGIYNLSSQKVMPLSGFIDFLLRKAHVPITIVTQKQRVRRKEPREIYVGSKKLRALGWRPTHSPFEGLNELLTEYRSK